VSDRTLRTAAGAVALAGAALSAYLAWVHYSVCTWCMVNDLVVAPLLALLTALRLRT
jgi:uncharacterized membrane protein